MADLVCADLSSRPVRAHLQEWLAAAQALSRAGAYLRAKLVLNTILQAHPGCVEAHVLLVQAHLHLGRSLWPKALQVARHGLRVIGSSSSSRGQEQAAQDQAQCQLALGLALGSVARLREVPQAERSQYRSEAREVLQAAAAQPGSHTVPSLYALALIDAEGGHYEQAVHHAQAALEAAEASGQPGGQVAPIVALIALLLSARQQLQAALSVVEAGLLSLQQADRCDAPLSSASSGSGGAPPHCHDVLLLRVRAQLLLVTADANGALSALGAARRRLAHARKGLGAAGQQGDKEAGTGLAAEVLREQEAQVWRDLALAYAGQQQPGDAQLCVAHMRQLEPHSAATYHAQGAVAAACRDDVAAKAAYKTALALDAAHAPSMLSLGALLRRQGDAHDLSVAVGLLTDALRYEPDSHVGWFNLGLARKAQGHVAEGERYLYTAVTLAAAAPVLSYGRLPLVL